MGSQAIAQPNVGHAREEEKSPDAKSGLLSGLGCSPMGRHGREPSNGMEAKVTRVAADQAGVVFCFQRSRILSSGDLSIGLAAVTIASEI